MTSLDESQRRPAIVVFVDHADCRWLRVLRRGFRHCFLVVQDGPAWIVCDSLKDRIRLTLLDLPPTFDLPAFYARRGHAVLVGRTGSSRARRSFGLAPLTCVTVVKRILGVRAPWVVTPWQLFRHLQGCPSGFVQIHRNDPDQHLTMGENRNIHRLTNGRTTPGQESIG